MSRGLAAEISGARLASFVAVSRQGMSPTGTGMMFQVKMLKFSG